VRRTSVAIFLLVLAIGCFARRMDHARFTAALATGKITGAGDDLRSGWYSAESALAPAVVAGATFHQLFSATVNGQVYAQPLVTDDGLLVIATETNDIYGFDAESGAQRWTRNLRAPFNASDIGCNDLVPTVGVTGTPVIDSTTNTAYLYSKGYLNGTSGAVGMFIHAIDLSNGHDRTGFPVQIQGTAVNDNAVTFDPFHQHQRPGLLLQNGVVYAGFGSHCDIGPYQGWVIGVDAASGRITSMWTDETSGGNEAGIWHTGGGLVSDVPGSIVFATGNGDSPNVPTAGHTAPGHLGEAVVRLTVQANGSLQTADFFAPFDSVSLNNGDTDLGSGGPLALPPGTFGTAAIPHLLVTSGKQGYVYLLNGDDLGGIGNGSGATDRVLGRYGPRGGVFGKPSAWPGDGGWVYFTTADGPLDAYRYGIDGNGNPQLTYVASTQDTFAFASSSPVVTSDGMIAGSALVWLLTQAGELRAYDAVPANGTLNLRFMTSVGQTTKFNVPGVGPLGIYVGTKDGHVIGFGPPPGTLEANGLDFGTVFVGSTATRTATLTASGPITLTKVSANGGPFTIGMTTPALPSQLQAGGQVMVQVTFAPTQIATSTGSLVATTQNPSGVVSITLSGRAIPTAGRLEAMPASLDLGATAVGSTITGGLIVANRGGSPVLLRQVTLPPPPFNASGAPAATSTLAPDQSVSLTVTFRSLTTGTFDGMLSIDSSAGPLVVPMHAMATAAAALSVMPLALEFPATAPGAESSLTFTVKNDGGSPLQISRSKPPAMGVFVATSSLAEGTNLAPGASRTETVVFRPKQAGTFSDQWSLNSNDGSGLKLVRFDGTASAGANGGRPPPALTGGCRCTGTR
jgi:iron transport multicopper oxidase